MDTETPLWARLDEPGEYREVARTRLEHVVRIGVPMLLCSQIQRSGGTLFSRLFDGHPEVHAHPHELKIGPKDRWPKLDLEAPGTWFETLYEESAAGHLLTGWSKPGLKETDVDVFPFLFLPGIQERLFHACVGQRAIERQRDVLDCYFTAYFNAWIDNQNLYAGPKKLLTAFATRTSLHAKSVRAVLPGLSRRMAGDDRPRAACLVRVGFAPPGAVRGSRGRDGALARLGDGGGRRTSALRRPGDRAHVRGARPGHGGDDAAGRRAGGPALGPDLARAHVQLAAGSRELERSGAELRRAGGQSRGLA